VCEQHIVHEALILSPLINIPPCPKFTIDLTTVQQQWANGNPSSTSWNSS